MVRCSDCGYLAIRLFSERILVEVELQMREEWRQPPLGSGSTQNRYDTPPICFAAEPTFVAELKAQRNQSDSEAYGELVCKERQCNKFIPWVQGFTPKEHRGMDYLTQQLTLHQEWQERQQERQERKDEEEREWRKQESERLRESEAKEYKRREADAIENRKLLLDQDKRRESEFGDTVFWMVVVASLITASAAIIGSLIEYGWYAVPKVEMVSEPPKDQLFIQVVTTVLIVVGLLVVAKVGFKGFAMIRKRIERKKTD